MSISAAWLRSGNVTNGANTVKSLFWLCSHRRGDLLHRRERLSHGLQRLSTTLERESCIHDILYFLSVGVSFLPFNWWQVCPPPIMPFSPSKCNSDWVVVGGHLKWTPQRVCLGNEIALAMAFCYVAPQCILMISGTWHSTAGLTQLHKSNQIYYTFTAIAWYLSPVSFLLIFLLVCPNSPLLWRSYKIPVTIKRFNWFHFSKWMDTYHLCQGGEAADIFCVSVW